VSHGEQPVGENGRRPSMPRAVAGSADRVPAPRKTGESSTLRVVVAFALFVVTAAIVGCVLGLALAVWSDNNLEVEHRRALRGAVEALHAMAPDFSRIEPRLIRMLEQASGLKGLKFDPDPPEADREVQSLIDHNGRIVGWFSWETQRPAMAFIWRLLPLSMPLAVGFLAFVGFALWRLKRLGLLLSKNETQMRKLAREDRVTGLANRDQILALLDEKLAARTEGGAVAYAVFEFGGIDDLKDAIGGGEEDRFLIAIAERLRATLPEGTGIGRLSGDRFGIVLSAGVAGEAVEIAGAAREALSRAFWVNSLVQISANVGVAVAPRDGTTCNDLVRRADLAMRGARRRGRGVVVAFSAEMESDFDELQFIKKELPLALARRAFDILYQPIVKAENAKIVGVEALLRWRHATRGEISPGLFIRVAEESALIDQLGEFALRRALKDAARWPGLYIAVNVSSVQMRARGFVEMLRAILAETKITPSRVVLEITESVMIDDPETAKSRLDELRSLGVRLAIDDFGSGYSSLTYLQRLPFDKLKIDRGFVQALEHSANTGVVIQAIVSLGRALGLCVLVEGVETEEQRVLLRLAGCNEMQGFLFSAPMAGEEIDRLVGIAYSSAQTA
jgi:diguanylate cyclase (GGDEF)-like protein